MTPVSVPTASCADAASRQGTVATNAIAAKLDFSMLNLPLGDRHQQPQLQGRGTLPITSLSVTFGRNHRSAWASEMRAKNALPAKTSHGPAGKSTRPGIGCCVVNARN